VGSILKSTGGKKTQYHKWSLKNPYQGHKKEKGKIYGGAIFPKRGIKKLHWEGSKKVGMMSFILTLEGNPQRRFTGEDRERVQKGGKQSDKGKTSRENGEDAGRTK